MKIIKINNNIKILSVAIIAVLIVGTGLFLTNEDKSKEETVVIRTLDSTTPSAWEIVQKLTGRDILTEHGVKLELISSASMQSGGTVQIQAQLAGNIDYAGGGAWPARINAIAAGGKIKTVVNSVAAITKNNPGNGLVVLENSSIYTAKDLTGKKIAVNVLGAEADYVIRQYLKQNGLSIDKVELTVVDTNNQEQLLRSGQVDVAAWVTTAGAAYKLAIGRGGLRELPGTRNYDIKGANIPYGGGFRDDFIKEHPETVKRFVTAYEKSTRIIYDEFQKDPQRVKKAVAQIYEEKGGNPKLAAEYTPTFDPSIPFITDKDVQWWLEIFEFEGKLKPGQIKPSDVYTNEFNPYYTGEIK